MYVCEICECSRVIYGTDECSECGVPLCGDCGELCHDCWQEREEPAPEGVIGG